MRVRESGQSKQAEFKPSDLQKLLDEDRRANCAFGNELIAVRYGPSSNICRAVRVTVLACTPYAITVNTDKIYGEGTASSFRRTTGVEVGAVKRKAEKEGIFWKLHAVTPETEEFLEAAEMAFEVEKMDTEVRGLIAGASRSELAAVIGLFKEMRKWQTQRSS